MMSSFSKQYDICVIGSGLAGLTAANRLAKCGHSVLLLEQHTQLGGLAAYFKRPSGYTFDVSLHGFPVGMIKSCRRYWNSAIADAIVPLKRIRFVNPQFQIETPFDRVDFTHQLIHTFHIPAETVERFFNHLRAMNFYDADTRTTGELFETFFPNRPDVHRLLMEPITYANGSTLDDPAITYGIVFSNFMSQGVYTFKGGTDRLIQMMTDELRANGVTLMPHATVQAIYTQDKQGVPTVAGVQVNDQTIECKAVLSNANLKTTVLQLINPDILPDDFRKETEKVRLNNSSCQVYIGIKESESIPNIGDLIFTSSAPLFSSAELKAKHTQSRTFSVYYPGTRPDSTTPRYTIVASSNALWQDWASLTPAEYQSEKERLKQDTLEALSAFIPHVEQKIGWIECATPRTFNRYTQHLEGASFGTKFEGLKISMNLSDYVHGLYHAGSVGIIMSGWLGTINYGVITADKVDRYVRQQN